MHIDSIRIVNYRAFADTGWLRLGAHRNIVIGRNNSGKSAFLEAFGLSRCSNIPFIGNRIDEHSEFQLILSISADDIWDAVQRTKNMAAIHFPFPKELPSAMSAEDTLVSEHLFGMTSPKTNARQAYIDKLIDQESFLVPLAIRASGNAGFVASPPDFVPYGQEPYDAVSVSISPLKKIAVDPNSVSIHGLQQIPTFQNIFWRLLHEQVFVFRAQRNVGSLRQFERSEYLQEDASNLPVSLLTMQGERPNDFDELKIHIKTVIPDITNISVVPLADNNVQIQIWSLDTEGNNIAFPLSECGTGVGQIIAILFSAMNKKSNIIVVDEPNSFLHPGASKALIRILSNLSNQYIFSTHSTDLILSTQPETIHMVTRSAGASHLEKIDPSEVEGNRRILRELGISLADVMGYEHVVWVEGETEQEAFPKLLQGTSQHTIPAFIAVRHTSDFSKKSLKHKTVIEIYERLSSTSALMPTTTKFSFDREELSDFEIADILRLSHGKIKFLKRRCIENYLISSSAIFSVISEEMKGTIAFSIRDIEALINEFRGDKDETEWVVTVNAPKVLHDIFARLTDSKLEFRKGRHSIMLIDFIQKNDSSAITELIQHVLMVSQP